MESKKLAIIVCCTERWFQVPVGTFGISSLLTRSGVEHHILHSHAQSPLETRQQIDQWIDDGFSFALVLHWKENASTFYELAGYLKSRIEEPTRIICGGITASYFWEDILSDPTLPDAVVRGDAETAILDYCLHRPFREIPNLAFRDGSETVAGTGGCTVDEALFSSLCFTDFSRLKNAKRFVDVINTRYFHVNITRGCAANCEFCGGSAFANRRHSNRVVVVKRPVARVVEDVEFLFQQVRAHAGHLRMHLDDIWENYFPVVEQLSQLDIAKDILLTVSDRGVLRAENLQQQLSVFKAFRSVTFELSPESDNAEQRKAMMPGTGREAYETDEVLELVNFIGSNGMTALVFYTLYNFRDTPEMIFNRLRICDFLRAHTDPSKVMILPSSLALDVASADYCSLPNPPRLVDYRNPGDRFTSLLGNLTLVRSEEDWDYLLTARICLVMQDQKYSPQRDRSRPVPQFSPEEVLEAVRALKLRLLVKQDFVRSGQFIGFVMNKLVQSRMGR